MRDFNDEIVIVQNCIYKLENIISELETDEISLQTLEQAQEACRFMSSKFIPNLRKSIRLV